MLNLSLLICLDSGKPLVCAGWEMPQSAHVDTCWLYNKATKAWTQSGQISLKNRYLGSNVHPLYGLMMVGGQANSGGNIAITSRMETTRNGASYINTWPGPSEAISEHCQITVDEDRVIVMGGTTSSMTVSDKAYIMNATTAEFGSAITMPNPRRGPFCGVLRNATGAAEKIVVGGGLFNNQFRNDYDIYDLNTKTWTPTGEIE